MVWPTVIDRIIDLIHSHLMMYPVRWTKNDKDIIVILYGGYCGSIQVDQILDMMGESIEYKWFVKTCNMWSHKGGDKRPIYRGDDFTEPKNTQWGCIKGVEMHLIFSVSSVGVPELWTNNMRSINAGRSQKDQ